MAAPSPDGPWRLTWRRLRRDRFALAGGAAFLLILAACLAAPLWAQHVAGTGPEENHLTDRVVVDGVPTDVVDLRGSPIGPTWGGRFFLGADANGRDVMVRLLYGGRNSLLIGLLAALGTIAAGLVISRRSCRDPQPGIGYDVP